MAFKFRVQDVLKHKANGTLTGANITVRCVRLDDDTEEVTGSSTLSWFAGKDQFTKWPPTRKQQRAYIVSYLQETPHGKTKSRADEMKDATAVIEHTRQNWAEGQRRLPIS